MNTGERLIELLDPKPGEQILDAGCGLGVLTAAIAARGAQVTGMDISSVLLEQARLLCPAATWLCAGFLQAPPEPRFDALFSHAAMHWFGSYSESSRRMFAWLRPGGRIALSVGGLTPGLAMMETGLPSAGAMDLVLSQAGFQDLRTLSEPGLLLITGRRPG